MVVFAQLAAVVLYLIPVVAVLWLTARRDRPLMDPATFIPATVALDLLGVMLLSRLMRLELAAVVSRGLWIIGAALWFDRRQRRGGGRPSRPEALDRRAIAGLAGGALVGGVLSVILSRPNAIWDRELHIPFVGSLRGQRMPFASPFEPGAAFHYHFAGDVLASMFQIFSFDVINASLALSLAHDVMFVLIALTIGLALLDAGKKPVHVVALAVAAVLLSGPCVLRFGVGEPYLGYSYYALYIWGFRPHQNLAMLMFAGIAAVLLRRSERSVDGLAGGRAWRGIGPLGAMMALLSVTDETSVAVLGLCLGIAWLFNPALLAPTRWLGLAVLGGLLLAFLGPNLVFAASLAPGGPVQKLSFVAPRSPGVQAPPIPLSTGPGLIAFAADTLPVWAILLAILLMGARREQDAGRPRRGFFAFAIALGVVSIVGLTTVDVNGGPPESHRFLTAALFLFPVVGVLRLDDWWRPGTVGRTLVISALVLGAGSTLLWLSHYRRHATPESYFRQRGQNLHTSDCRAVAGAGFGQKPALTYVEPSVFYAYAGCKPVFVPGERRTKYWSRKEYPTLGRAAFPQLDREMAAADATVDAICPTGRPAGDVDPVCNYALTRKHCDPEGSDYVRCPLAPSDRSAILARH